MIRIPRRNLDDAIDALLVCAKHATESGGLRIQFPLGRSEAEAAILGGLSIIAHPLGPVTASDVVYFDGQMNSFPRAHGVATDEGARK